MTTDLPEADSDDFDENRPRSAYWDRASFTVPSSSPHLSSLFRLFAYASVTTALLPVQLLALAFWPRLADRIPRFHHRLTAWIIGMTLVREGQPSAEPGTLFVSNHVSYLDIIVLGAVLQARFVAKSDVSGWPVFGTLARLSRTLFIERRASSARGEIEQVRRHLEKGDRLIVFPEGTSGDGIRVLPFKSTLFAAVDGTDTIIQPVSLRYTRLNGIPLGRALRPLVAWYGEMEMLPHLWVAVSCGALEVRVVFHEPVRASRYTDRKSLARHCHAKVVAGADYGVPPASKSAREA